MNIELFEGQSCLVHIKLPEDWEVYGGTPKGEFKAERESSDSVLVTIPPMEAEFTPLVPYELFARRILDGKEWLVLSGQLHVRRRYSDAGGGISAIEYFVEPKLVEDGITSSPQIIVGIPGPQGPKGDKGEPGEGGMTSEERATLAGAAQRGGYNTFTASNTFTGSVDMSTAQVTPPEGWNVGGLTPEAIQTVAPIAWDETSVTFGEGASNTSSGSVVIGANATNKNKNNTLIGANAKTSHESFTNAVGIGAWTTVGHSSVNVGNSTSSGSSAVTIGNGSRAVGGSTALGCGAESNVDCSVTVGMYATSNAGITTTIGTHFEETVDGTKVTHTCKTQGTGSITIGAGANTLNNGSTESSNSVTIGCKASNSGADSVVIGAQARGSAQGSVALGAKSEAKGSSQNIALGTQAKSNSWAGIAIGAYSTADNQAVSIGRGATTALGCLSFGSGSTARGKISTAIGYAATVSDAGATVIRSTAEDGTYTQLYFSGANTPLANTYHDGAPMLGYVTKDSAGNIVAAGTRSLIDLLTENSTFAPASLDENGEWVMPKVFHPSDLDMPVEEPSEPEEYQPLPIYPIVEPDDIMGDNGTLEQGGPENTSPATNS